MLIQTFQMDFDVPLSNDFFSNARNDEEQQQQQQNTWCINVKFVTSSQ